MSAEYSAELVTMPAENQVIAGLAAKAAARTLIELIPGELAGLVLEQGQELRQVDLGQFGENPRRKTGSVVLADADSFVEYVNRHRSQGETTLWSNVDNGTMTAVLNDHGVDTGEPGFGDHRAKLQVKDSPDWKHWAGLDGKFVAQDQFAIHIEDGAGSVKDPDAATMLELAQSFQAATKVDFKSGQRLDSGQVQLRYEETTQATAGHQGSISIPSMISLELQVFEGGAVYALKARFMYRITDGKLVLGYRLIRPDVARKLAFDDLASVVSTGVELPVMAGTPRS